MVMDFPRDARSERGMTPTRRLGGRRRYGGKHFQLPVVSIQVNIYFYYILDCLFACCITYPQNNNITDVRHVDNNNILFTVKEKKKTSIEKYYY